jgi:hypothetical protein
VLHGSSRRQVDLPALALRFSTSLEARGKRYGEMALT